MASIEKRNNKYRAEVSNYKHGKQTHIRKTFDTKKEAELWALKNEIAKGNGVDLAKRETCFANFFENWVYVKKKNDVRPATFTNYVRTIPIIKRLFGDIKISQLNDTVCQLKIDEYGENHSRKTTTEVLLKLRTSLRYAYARGLLTNDFSGLIKTRGKEAKKRNLALSITDFKKLRKYLIENHEDDFQILVLLALETGARRGELLGLQSDDVFKYGIKIHRSISPTSDDTELKTRQSRREVSINIDVWKLLKTVKVKENGYLFETNNFKQSSELAKLLKKLNLMKTTFHGLRDTHASFLFSDDRISIDYISKRLGHSNILTTQQYYLQLMPEKKHQQDADALDLLNSLSE